MRDINRASLFLLFLAVIIPYPLFAQSTSARIVGTVTDASGADNREMQFGLKYLF